MLFLLSITLEYHDCHWQEKNLMSSTASRERLPKGLTLYGIQTEQAHSRSAGMQLSGKTGKRTLRERELREFQRIVQNKPTGYHTISITFKQSNQLYS
jgi:hypothetical protein